ncbi:hypothetical protein H696_02808 [Fonticula alba]|uniref:Uncharacterized protein n=1 Tax=Fonticula alba TaxID=691883 RepID=A0A058ZAL5_FONAL|nr:hypothetical protein H696_02808 [Fonticula alba]KCV70467.1 hypothetical protein H696_02808 [Fonticula alba]|eukprot:XP_009494983.1 hypothetical protein H696_02808 [Fonticula alba]
MGCTSSKQKDRITSDIDDSLAESDARGELNLKILLLGPGESGKSTFLKQIKLIYDIKLTDVELSTLASSLKRNTMQCMQILVDKAHQFDLSLGVDEEIGQAILDYELGDDSNFDGTIAEIVSILWKNPAIQETFKRRNEFWILEAAPYYFENVQRVASPDFQPTERDIVMTRVVTTGITSTQINIPEKQMAYTIVDVGGQRNERRKWIHCFDRVKAVLFVINLADYNNVLYEDTLVNRMTEAVQLFATTANNTLFENTPFFLVLNKRDLLEEVLPTRSIQTCEAFSDYTGDRNDVNGVIEFISAKLRGMVHNGDPGRVHVLPMSACQRSEIETAWELIKKTLEESYSEKLDASRKYLADRGLDVGPSQSST